MLHPKGIDFDGQFMCASVAEYRPNGQSIVYNIDPETMQPEEVFRFPDHLGSRLKDFTSDTLYNINWGSWNFYRWGIDARQHESSPDSSVMHPNSHHSIDYQVANGSLHTTCCAAD